MYQRIPWEIVAGRLGSAEHTLGTAGIRNSNRKLFNYRNRPLHIFTVTPLHIYAYNGFSAHHFEDDMRIRQVVG